MMMASHLLLMALLLLATAMELPNCNAWTTTSNRFHPIPSPRHSFTTTSRTPQAVDVSKLHESSSRISPSHEPLTRPRRRRPWIRALASFVGLFLVTSLISPQSAFASTTTAVAADAASLAVDAAVDALPTAVAVAPILPPPPPPILPSPVPPIVELRLTLRLLFASLLGAAVGKERSSTHKHSAGVRTMALVALGACAFTVCSSFGFYNALGRCDPSRMASNVASGVGFVGAGVITTTSANPQDSRQSIVHGLTTATAIWISAAIGVACGVGMLYIATAATLSTITILRFGRVKKKFQRISNNDKHQHDNLQQQQHGANGDAHPVLVTPTPSPNNGGINGSSTTPLLKSKTVSLQELNSEDDWDSHVEDVDQEEEEEDDQEIVSKVERLAEQRPDLLKLYEELAEYQNSGQAHILEQALAVSRGTNLTDFVVNESSAAAPVLEARPTKKPKQQSYDYYSDAANASADDDDLHMVPARRKTSYSNSRSNETLAP